MRAFFYKIFINFYKNFLFFYAGVLIIAYNFDKLITLKKINLLSIKAAKKAC